MVKYITADTRRYRLDRTEAARYAGGNLSDSRFAAVIEECEAELTPLLSPSACYETYPVSVTGEEVSLGFTVTRSRDLAGNLAGCDSVILLAATVGAGADRLLQRYSRLSPLKAVAVQGLAAAALEGYLDALEEELVAPYAVSKPRFSPGYGDLPLSLQANIERALCFGKIGISLTSSGMMVPTKSVTALLGVSGRTGQ